MSRPDKVGFLVAWFFLIHPKHRRGAKIEIREMKESDDLYVKLPQDVIFQILFKLPTRTLLNLRCVSKSFVSLISHPYFLRLRLSCATAASHHLLYYESSDYTKIYFSFHDSQTFSLCQKLETPFKSVNGYLRLVGSSRGVVCLFDTNYFNFVGTVILWNPFIGKYKILPCVQGFRCFKSSFSHMAVGFGFDQTNLDFKVVKILYGYDDNEHELRSEALVYGVKTGSWRNIGQVVPCFMPKNWCSNAFVHGVVHWMAYRRPQFDGHLNCIMGFDVVEDIFTLMELPQNLGPNCKELRLSPLVNEKSLSLFVSHRENMGESWDVWLMNDYGNVDSWTLKYVIVLEQVFVPIKIVNDGEILAAISDELLVLMNVETQEVMDLAVCGLPLSFYAADYDPSLALIDIGQLLTE
ncbi:F-box/kelch-repeat protein At3g06240-like [Primulina huaijiensis]|uniref:F-box/kelch-repeat protein At3g06240-like n=1 Tax=Primulina huaijiensis TaxID=1492673 RepID=UPI003CC6F3CD